MTERDFIGYGKTPPIVRWPNGAQIAISVVVNYEEGSEYSLLDGDSTHEVNNEVPSPVPLNQRDLANESFFEYGSRVGVWRILKILDEYSIPASFFSCALALERNPTVGPAIVSAGHEVVGHGNRLEEYYLLGKEDEKLAIETAVKSITASTGVRPVGWYTRYAPSENTRKLIASHGGFLYDSNSYSDDIPYYVDVDNNPWLVIPYSLEVNDTRFWRGGMNRPSDFLETLINTFDVLYEEGAENPKLMNIGLHCRIAGRPSRAAVLKQFFDYVETKNNVWFTRRDQIADWWLKEFPPEN